MHVWTLGPMAICNHPLRNLRRAPCFCALPCRSVVGKTMISRDNKHAGATINSPIPKPAQRVRPVKPSDIINFPVKEDGVTGIVPQAGRCAQPNGRPGDPRSNLGGLQSRFPHPKFNQGCSGAHAQTVRGVKRAPTYPNHARRPVSTDSRARNHR